MIFRAKYDCIYEAHGKGGNSLDNLVNPLNTSLAHYACFGRIYSQLRNYTYSDVTYRIYLFKEDLPEKNFNLCTKLETKKILRCLQKTVPFTYKFESGTFTMSEYNAAQTNFNILVVNIKGTFAQHLWVTTMLRCFFEWPYNVAAKEACSLQSEVKVVDGFNLSNENWVNLYLTIVAQLGGDGLHGIVEFGKHPKAKTYQEWQQKLAGIKGNCSLVSQLKVGGGRFARNVEHVNIRDQETLDAGTKSRASKYVAAYKDKLSWKN